MNLAREDKSEITEEKLLYLFLALFLLGPLHFYS
jgi:hypothetical protein